MKQVSASAIAIAMIVAGCASSPDPAPASPPPADGQAPNGPVRGIPNPGDDDFLGAPTPTVRRHTGRASGGAVPAKDYLPYIDVAIDEAAVYSEFGDMLQDRYTRIQIVTLKPDAYDMEGVTSGVRSQEVEARNYDEESRGWFSRMMSSRSITRTLIAEFDVAKPDITATNALFSSTFSSNNREGESWTTNESISVYATPYFKVGPNTTIEARFRLQLSDEKESSASANVMGALTTAANLIAPTSTLVTYFNAPLMMEASNFLNNSTSTLFGQSITEQSVSAFSVKAWSDKPILVVSAQLPDTNDIKDTRGKGAIGQWAVYLDQPIPSIFTAGVSDTGYPDFTGVTSGDILAFDVGEDLTVYDYIFSRLDLSDRISYLNSSADPDVAGLICNRIERGLSEIGFTSYDAAAAVWAASVSDQFNGAAKSAFQGENTCEAMIRWKALGG
ncbi:MULTISPECIES: hypothetical protein [unclassified Hyphomonas]|jgi:hypothetical protein|uniref:hypothetical protein n=1 Tax=unclassified Hyphomonas TaxID=2630699 RepID=UPI000C4F6F9A|nr:MULTISPECIES: hypothetical protein [unclassified Hyphomonas]MAL45141.1 hypothetical protein [Hyphomonas sp.]MAX83639.1 hypothetical protein [Hyphomonas sp.]MBO6581643.1 hypothetical protein [Hyphomonas sp.]MDF1807736.1 hypothetical protein [Hyphomonas sp.]QSR23455.1 hypothetical protein CFA77_14265 [Hyphomonas sp. KY3]|tara:strand:- start:2693 stop:4030 length:1338 start_codon:yes stop_codon:yes gene_type:complete